MLTRHFKTKIGDAVIIANIGLGDQNWIRKMEHCIKNRSSRLNEASLLPVKLENHLVFNRNTK